MAERFYITTAIAYPNGRPHIGHAYEAIATDVIARFQRMMGRDVYFLTGTDEHGLKMAQTARDRSMETRALADEMSGYFREMDEKLDISFDRFIRTTEADHHAASQAIWQAMAENDDLYLDRYEGWYSVRDEAFYDEKELSRDETGQFFSPQGTPVEWTAEETWFFKLSKYQDRLLKHYAENPEFIRPDRSRNEVVRFVEGGLSDLSVSRTSFDWGVKVPGSDGHVMYVWVDALTNYLTGAGYPGPSYTDRWPADVHIIGKDIARFHAVYWPAFLMSAKIALPKSVFAHGFLLHRGEKMSKSTGNVVDPIELAERYGVDALRYFLLREVNFGQDGSYSDEAIVTRANADLSNSFGNLAQRVLSFIAKNLNGLIPGPDRENEDDADGELAAQIFSVCDRLVENFEALRLSQGIEAWMEGVFACNQYVDAQAPWSLRKTNPARMKVVLYHLLRAIGDLAIAIRPVIPSSADKLLDYLDVPSELRTYATIKRDRWFSELIEREQTLQPPSPIFPRLELPAAAAS